MSMVAMARPAPLTMQPMVAVERHVVEIVFGGLDLLLVLFVTSRSAAMSRVPVERVVVEPHLGVEAEQLTGLGDHERVDLEQAHVLGGERRVELRDQAFGLLADDHP